jgi:peptidoglycan/LPS O-acetylase OafA/YrhL
MWFVPFIAQVYILLPALCAANRRLGNGWFLGACFAASFVADLAAIWLCPYDIREVCRNWSPLFRLGEVAIGVAWADPQGGSKARAGLVYLALALALTQMERLVPGAAYLWLLPLKTAAVALPILLAAVALSRILRPWLPSAAPSLRLAGQASYPFFLAHGVPMQSVLRLCDKSFAGWLAYLAVCWMGAVALQWLMNRVRGRRT